MTENRFDQFARFTATRSRRSLLKGALGFLLGSTALTVSDDAVEGASCREAGTVCREHANCCSGICGADARGRKSCVCPPGQKECKGACIAADACCANSDCASLANQCQSAVCDAGSGKCLPQPFQRGRACNDGNACTRVDTCDGAGNCVGSDPVVCTALDQCHVAGTCDPTTGQCSNPNKTDGTSCNDSNACTNGDQCHTGTCVRGERVVCTTDNPCEIAFCDPAVGCTTTPRDPGVSCEDANRCDGTEVCDGQGNCVGGTPVSCGPCLICDKANGQCVADPSLNGTNCPGDPTDKCVGNWTCSSGSCLPTQVTTCPDTACHEAGTCNPATGLCEYTDLPDGTSCGEDDLCTRNKQCRSGVCEGQSFNPCALNLNDCMTGGVCDPASGACINQVPKDDGSMCSNGLIDACTEGLVCKSGACTRKLKDCSEAADNECQAGACDPLTGNCYAVAANENGACVPSDECGVMEGYPGYCDRGSCESQEFICVIPDDDDYPCFSDVICAPIGNGISDPCVLVYLEDGTPCGSNETCQSPSAISPSRCRCAPGFCRDHRGICLKPPQGGQPFCVD